MLHADPLQKAGALLPMRPAECVGTDCVLFHGAKPSSLLLLPAPLFKGLVHLPKANVFKASFPIDKSSEQRQIELFIWTLKSVWAILNAAGVQF